MARRHRGLGVGVDALLSKSMQAQAGADGSGESRNKSLMVAVDRITPNRLQPRTQADKKNIGSLAESIRRDGILQALLVRPSPNRDGHYELIAGERRWRAAMQAGLQEVPVLIRDSDDQSSATLALIENIQREDLSALEKAAAIERLLNTFHLSHQALAEQLGQSRSAISNLLRLLQLAPQAKEYLRGQQIEEGHARALLGLPAEQQDAAAREVVDKKMNVRQAEAYVRQLNTGGKKKKKKVNAEEDAEISRLQRHIAEQLGTPVRIAHHANGHGDIIIHYASLDVLDGLLDNMLKRR